METVEHVIVTGDEPDFGPLEGKQLHGYEALLEEASDEFDWVEVDERDAAAMCYTSGTTGNPKGVVYSHRSVVLHSMSACMGDAMNLSPSSSVLVIVPQFHANAWGLPYAAMIVGASLIMPDRHLQPEPLLKMIELEKPNFAGAVPTIWQGVLSLLKERGSGDAIASLEEVIVGGSACPPALMKTFQEDYGVRIIHAWGMTETSPLGSVARAPGDAEDEWPYRITQGRFAANVEARLIADDGSVQPWDNEAVGELECRGKDVIKSGGEWISSVDLENAIMGHPAVAEAAVIGIPDPKWDERPLASVVIKSGEDVSAEDLKGFLADKVAKWQLPDSWAFIDEVPKTSVGKFDKKVIRQRFADGELDVVKAS
jgi:fatty-acyl-CoA synthase